MPAGAKVLRSDAQRNHDLIVASARELFAARGVDVSVEEITQHAGVGMGTLYRHFPTKDELIDAVLDDAFADFVALAKSAVAAEDAWAGFTRFVQEAIAIQAANRGLKELFTGERGKRRLGASRARLRPLLAQLIARAQAQGALRPDFAVEDLAAVFAAGPRVNELLFDGLRVRT